MRARALGIALLLALGGCSTFRASAGIALGIGGSVKAGPVDVGCLGGADLSVGNYYDVIGGVHLAADIGIPAIARGELIADLNKKEGRIGFSSLLLLPLYPLMLASPDKEAREALPFLWTRPTEVAVSVYALIFAIHLGFDPGEVVRGLASCASLAAGLDAPDPPVPASAVFAPPEDGLMESGFALVTSDDLAVLDSGTALEMKRAREKFATTMADPRALIELEEGDFVRWVEPRLGLEDSILSLAAAGEITQLRDHGEAFARAARSTDPAAIAETLSRYPLAPASARALLEQREGELLLEAGAIQQAAWCFEESLHHTDGDADALLEAAGARLAVARRLLEAMPRRATTRNAWSGSADLNGSYLGAQERAVWCMTAEGDIAWERSDALPPGFTESKVIGVESGLALLEAQVAGRPWVVALDFDGRVAWTTPLPAAVACGSPMDQFYVHGLGRLYVGRVDRVIALDAATGRALWMTAKKGLDFNFQLAKPIVPMDHRPAPGPPRRRPDGETGFQIRLTHDALEVQTSGRAATDRYDLRTGRSLAAPD